MKSEDKVRALHPKAIAERQFSLGSGVYWLIRVRPRASMYLASGKTRAAAWKAASETIDRLKAKEQPST